MHFAIADRWPGASPIEVLEEWTADEVADALQIMSAEERYRIRNPTPKA